MRGQISIIGLLITLTLGSIISTTWLIANSSSKSFEAQAHRTEESTSLRLTSDLSSEIDKILEQDIDKAQAIGLNLLSLLRDKKLIETDAIDKIEKIDSGLFTNFTSDPYIFDLQLFEVRGAKQVSIYSLVNSERLTAQRYDSNYFEQQRNAQRFPFHHILQNRVIIQNSSVPKGLATITLGVPILKDSAGHISHFVIVDLSLSQVQRLFNEDGDRKFYMIDADGNVLAHYNENHALIRKNLKDHELVSKFINGSLNPRQQLHYFDSEFKENYLASVVKTNLDAFVVGLSSEDSFLEPIKDMKRQVYYWSSFFGFLSLGLTYLLLTFGISAPILALHDLFRGVQNGNLPAPAKRMVSSIFTEINPLFTGFDQMTQSLKERERSRTIVGKFQGTVFADDILRGRLSTAGTSKDATLLFVDIRGFAAFSEARSPEEVVQMINLYLATISKIIIKNGGFLDNYLGDTILAVWGAPKTTGRDPFLAMKVAIDIRMALGDLNSHRIELKQPPIYISMGVHTGPVIAGNIGYDDARLNYSVLGDSVTAVTQLGALTGTLQVDLLVSETTAYLVDKEFALIEVGRVASKVRTLTHPIFKVLGSKNSAGEITEIKTLYSEGSSELSTLAKSQNDQAA